MPWWQFFSNCLTKKDITLGPFAAASAGRQREGERRDTPWHKCCLAFLQSPIQFNFAFIQYSIPLTSIYNGPFHFPLIVNCDKDIIFCLKEMAHFKNIQAVCWMRCTERLEEHYMLSPVSNLNLPDEWNFCDISLSCGNISSVCILKSDRKSRALRGTFSDTKMRRHRTLTQNGGQLWSTAQSRGFLTGWAGSDELVCHSGAPGLHS